ncbi:hypothetical protein EJ08DRAFT_650519 [Tothia fuscella]|uniref:Uncharacterized protein n=1 Tax=Tothia fuscella TaxID=1048955 RepID=A0A9P4NPZ8_9PEZI|nr:hypothetical protein EJ08DRAFT_650519 [Tothia fuscella]
MSSYKSAESKKDAVPNQNCSLSSRKPLLCAMKSPITLLKNSVQAGCRNVVMSLRQRIGHFREPDARFSSGGSKPGIGVAIKNIRRRLRKLKTIIKTARQKERYQGFTETARTSALIHRNEQTAQFLQAEYDRLMDAQKALRIWEDAGLARVKLSHSELRPILDRKLAGLDCPRSTLAAISQNYELYEYGVHLLPVRQSQEEMSGEIPGNGSGKAHSSPKTGHGSRSTQPWPAIQQQLSNHPAPDQGKMARQISSNIIDNSKHLQLSPGDSENAFRDFINSTRIDYTTPLEQRAIADSIEDHISHYNVGYRLRNNIQSYVSNLKFRRREVAKQKGSEIVATAAEIDQWEFQGLRYMGNQLAQIDARLKRAKDRARECGLEQDWWPEDSFLRVPAWRPYPQYDPYFVWQPMDDQAGIDHVDRDAITSWLNEQPEAFEACGPTWTPTIEDVDMQVRRLPALSDAGGWDTEAVYKDNKIRTWRNLKRKYNEHAFEGRGRQRPATVESEDNRRKRLHVEPPPTLIIHREPDNILLDGWP